MVHIHLFVFVCIYVLYSLNCTLYFYTPLVVYRYSLLPLCTCNSQIRFTYLVFRSRCTFCKKICIILLFCAATYVISTSPLSLFFTYKLHAELHTIRHRHTDNTSHSYEANLSEPSNSVFTRNAEARGNK